MAKRADEKKNFFNEAVGFVEIFARVMAEGFFDDLSVEINGLEGKGATRILIKGTAYIPSNKRNMPPGITPFVNPAKMVESIRLQLLNNKYRIASRRCEIRTDDWAKLDRTGENVIGSRGLRIIFDFAVFLRPKQWEEKD